MHHLARILLAACATLEVAACAPVAPRTTDPVDLALKTCGLGVSTQSANVFKAAYEVAAKKSSVEFNRSMSQSIDTQEAVVLKAIGEKSPDAAKAVLAEIKDLRECVLTQTSELRPSSRMELLEQCRKDIEHRISPDPNIHDGSLRYWTQAVDDKDYRADMPVMHGIYERIGGGWMSDSSSNEIKARCDIRNGRLNDVIDLRPNT